MMPQPAERGKERRADGGGANRLGRDRQGLSRALSHEENSDDEDHDDRHVQADIHEILIELRLGQRELMRKFRTRSEHAPGARDDADRQIGFQIKHLRLQKPDDRPKQLKQNDHKQQIIQ